MKTDKFIEIKRDDLIGKYLGQTAHRTRALLDSGMDGVIFLDEAYSLGNEEGRDSFSKEAIDMLNIYLSEYKNRFMFIIAGYEDDIQKCFFNINHGLKRRFQTHYKINGYNPIELKNIFIKKISNSSFIIDISSEQLDNFFTKNNKSFTYHGGDIERLITETKQIQCLRVFNEGIKNNIIILEDIEEAHNNIFKISSPDNKYKYMYS